MTKDSNLKTSNNLTIIDYELKRTKIPTPLQSDTRADKENPERT